MGLQRENLVLVEAPSNLGLRMPGPGILPGASEAPAALQKAGLHEALRPMKTIRVQPMAYRSDPQEGTRLLNGRTIKAFNLALASTVESLLREGSFPLVLGGDCSILLGCLAGARRTGEVSLVHIDGHADFTHPGNYDPASRLGSVAGMDLALATGRGEELLTMWDGQTSPLVPDERVVQIGDREGRLPGTPYPDLAGTGIETVDIFWIREHGVEKAIARAMAALAGKPPYWVHLDVDVLDQLVLPAVDSPGSPGLDYDELIQLVACFCASPRCRGLNVTIFDPPLDRFGHHARALASALSAGLAAARE